MTAADLKPQELHILRALLAGKTLKQVAAGRGRNYNCITAQAHNLRVRLGLNNSVQLGAWCERHGIRESA